MIYIHHLECVYGALMMEFVRVTVTTILVLCMLSANGSEQVKEKLPCNFPAIYNFGDSNSDTGGISAAFYPMRPPNGETFFGKPVGRASDGRLMIDFIAERVGLPYLSAYLDSVGSNFRHGANFATGGSTIRPQNESFLVASISPFSLDIQTEHYNQFKSRSTYFYKQAEDKSCEKTRLPKPENFSNALYTLDIGQNDLVYGFQKLGNNQLREAIPDIINQVAVSIQNLYQLGARTFWIHNVGPVGCLPLTLYIQKHSPGDLDQNGCIKDQNDITTEFNTQLKNKVIQLRNQLVDAALTYVDVYAAKYGLIGNANNQGFVNPDKICCGFHDEKTHVWCWRRRMVNGSEVYPGSCEDPSAYISWDGVHYTEAANNWVVNQIANGLLSDPPIPITHACYANAESQALLLGTKLEQKLEL